MPDDDTPDPPADPEPQGGSRGIAGVRLSLNPQKRVVNRDTNETISGIVTFGARVTTQAAEESPIAMMQRWSALRQDAKKSDE